MTSTEVKGTIRTLPPADTSPTSIEPDSILTAFSSNLSPADVPELSREDLTQATESLIYARLKGDVLYDFVQAAREQNVPVADAVVTLSSEQVDKLKAVIEVYPDFKLEDAIISENGKALSGAGTRVKLGKNMLSALEDSLLCWGARTNTPTLPLVREATIENFRSSRSGLIRLTTEEAGQIFQGSPLTPTMERGLMRGLTNIARRSGLEDAKWWMSKEWAQDTIAEVRSSLPDGDELSDWLRIEEGKMNTGVSAGPKLLEFMSGRLREYGNERAAIPFTGHLQDFRRILKEEPVSESQRSHAA